MLPGRSDGSMEEREGALPFCAAATSISEDTHSQSSPPRQCHVRRGDVCSREACPRQHLTKRPPPCLRWSLLRVASSTLRAVCSISISAVLFVLLFACCDTALAERPDLSDVPTPPTFTHDPNPPVLWFVAFHVQPGESNGNSETLKERRFHCRAKGVPHPSFSWTKDGKPFELDSDPDRIVQIPHEGTFSIRKLKPEDRGVYQCFAKNDNGTAVDSKIEFKQAYINAFGKTDPTTVVVKYMNPHQDFCAAPRSEPPATVFWLLKGGSDAGQHQFTTLNASHISLVTRDQKGYIYFAYVDKDDMQSGNLYYTCAAENKVLKDYKFGDPFRFDVTNLPNNGRTDQAAPHGLSYKSDAKTKAIVGKTFDLSCIYYGHPLPQVTWSKVGGADWSKRVVFLNFNKTIQINDVQESDSGTYKCNLPGIGEHQFEVSVEAAPYWVKRPESKNSSEGEEVYFQCDAVGKPKVTYQFYKNGVPLSAGGRINIVGNQLHIRNLVKDENGQGDNAVYQCSATNEHGMLWANFYLNLLKYKPFIEDSIGQREAVEGKDTYLTCRAFGSPSPTVTWRHNGVPLTDGNVYEQQSSGGEFRLKIKGVQMSMAGNYTCVAHNKEGDDEGHGSLRVMQPTTIQNGPMDTLGPKGKTVVAGEAVTLECRILYDPKLTATVMWMHDDNYITADNPRYRMSRSGDTFTLMIPHTTRTESGQYSCVAQTHLDNQTQTGKLNVKDVPNPPSFPYVNCDSGHGRSVHVGWKYYDSVEDNLAPVIDFIVQVQADFLPDEWNTYPGNLAYQQSASSTGNSHDFGMQVSVAPNGVYNFRVIARNEVGESPPEEAKPSACKIAADLPDNNPSNVYAKGNEPSNLIIYWKPMPKSEWNGNGFRYRIRYRASDEPLSEEKVEEVKDPFQDHFVVSGLPATPYKKYVVSVQAVNEKGACVRAAQEEPGYSGEGRPNKAPTGFKVHSPNEKKPTEREFSWDKMNSSELNGEFKGYKLVHWSVEQDEGDGNAKRRKRAESAKKEAIFSPNVTGGFIYDLEPFATNKAYLTVFNGMYESEPSETIEIKVGEGRPSAPLHIRAHGLTMNKIVLVWSAPKSPNGVLLNYELTRQAYSGHTGRLLVGTVAKQNVSATVRSQIYDDLEVHTRYLFTVAAYTMAGLGDLGDAEATTLPHYVNDSSDPSLPAVFLNGVGDDHMNITWVPGEFDNNHTVGEKFYVQYREKGASQWSKEYPIGANMTVTVSGLKPGTEYEVQTVSVHVDKDGKERATSSPTMHVTTSGNAPSGATASWLIAIIVAVIILIIILILVCVVVRNRGAKYPVHEKEKAQGREPMLQEEKGFGEYAHPQDEEKRSLTGQSKADSETDSMADYGDGETGKFTEDGSFIGQYAAPNKNAAFVGDAHHPPPLSTFV